MDDIMELTLKNVAHLADHYPNLLENLMALENAKDYKTIMDAYDNILQLAENAAADAFGMIVARMRHDSYSRTYEIRVQAQGGQ